MTSRFIALNISSVAVAALLMGSHASAQKPVSAAEVISVSTSPSGIGPPRGLVNLALTGSRPLPCFAA